MKLPKLPQWYSFYGITLACSFGFALFGVDTGLMSGVLANKQFKEQFNYPNDTIVGQITSSFDLGCFVTAVAASIINNRWSRKSTVIIGCAIHIIGGIIQTASYGVPEFIVGRVIAGLGNGFITVAIPVWQSECTPAHVRGRMLGFLCLLNSLGGVLICWINYGMKFVNSGVAWRFPVAIQLLFSGATLIMAPFLGESPRWLLIKGRDEEARTVLAGLNNADRDSDEIQTLFLEIKYHVDHEEELAQSAKLKDLFNGQDRMKNMRRILLGASSQFMQQWGGINVILYYATVIYEDSLGFSNNMSYILTACNQMNYSLFLFIAATFLVERVGRKPLMFWGLVMQGICFAVVSGSLSSGSKNGGIVAISFMFLYYSTFGTTWSLSPWLYPTEINSLQYRNTGAAIATAMNWICNYIVVLITPSGIANIQWRYYLIYMVMNFAGAVGVYIYYEETAGLTLEEVDEMFEYGLITRSVKEIIPGNFRKRKLVRDPAVPAHDKPEDEFVEDVKVEHISKV